MSADTYTYFLGATNIAVAPGVTTTFFVPAAHVNGGFFKWVSGAGTLAIVPFANASFSTGYPVSTTEIVTFNGPARFHLAAATATMLISVATRHSNGISAPIAGM